MMFQSRLPENRPISTHLSSPATHTTTDQRWELSMRNILAPPPVCGNYGSFSALAPPMQVEGGRTIHLTRLQPASSNFTTHTLATYYPHKIFVGSLSRLTSPAELAVFFRSFGVVIEAKVVLDNTGNSKGYGFVSFASPEVTKNVLESGPHYLNGKRIAIASAIRKKHPDEKL